MQTILAKILAAGFAASMTIGGQTTPQTLNATITPAVIYSQNGNIVVIPSAERAVNTNLDAWIENLALLESKGRNNIKVLDYNGLHSFGCLQFQISTFAEFGTKYGFFSQNDNIGKLIYDCELQKKIAKLMILENPDNWRRWYTSVVTKGLGLPPIDEKPVLLSLR